MTTTGDGVSGVLVLDEHDLACLLGDLGVPLASLLGADQLVASFGSVEQGRAGLRRRDLLDDAEPPKPRGALGTIAAVVTRPDLLLGLHERRPPVPTVVLAVAREDVGLLMEPLPLVMWRPTPPMAQSAVPSASDGGGDRDGEGVPPPAARPRFQVGVTLVPVQDLVEAAIERSVLAGIEAGRPPATGQEVPEAAWIGALRAVGRDRLDQAVLELRAVGLEREAAQELAAAAAGVYSGGGAVAQGRRDAVVVQDDIGWFAPREEGQPWIIVEVPEHGQVCPKVTSAAGVAGRVRALVEEVR